MASMNDILSVDRLPAMPAAMAKLIPMLLDPKTEWDALEKVVRQDEAMTAAVLRLANSVMYGSAGKQFDLKRAMPRLGRDTLRRCVLQQQVSGFSAGDNAAFGLQRGAMWRSALGGAIVAEKLARDGGSVDPSLAFMCGLLRDIGKLALNVAFGAEYLPMVSAQAADGRSFIEAEQLALGFDHAKVGAGLARKWKLPERLVLAIQTHHAPPLPSEPGHDVLFDIVHAADTICRWAGLGVGVDGLEYRLAEHVRAELKLDRRTAEREIAMVWEKLREAEESLGEAVKQGAAA
jgi:putative nucleotidyltransferase with HDIG domain